MKRGRYKQYLNNPSSNEIPRQTLWSRKQRPFNPDPDLPGKKNKKIKVWL